MIHKVEIENFKAFKKATFDLKQLMLLAGPNNSGKTSLLQAISIWNFALQKWRLEKSKSRAKKHTGVPITRQEFLPVPVRDMKLLWHDTSAFLTKKEGKAGSPRLMKIRLDGSTKKRLPWSLTMEFRYTNQELIYARPAVKVPEDVPEEAYEESIVYVPPCSGILVDEPFRDEAYRKFLIGQGKPGDIIRNLLLEAFKNKETWQSLVQDVREIFNYSLLPPNYGGNDPHIIYEYLPGRHEGRGYGGLPRLDIGNSGSGFLQVLLLLGFIASRKSTVLLIDEPDAHMHVCLQDRIYDNLRSRKEQLIIATHSEVLLNNTEPENIYSFCGTPHSLTETWERAQVREAMKRLSAMDHLLAEEKSILYVEGESDLSILKAWAKSLEHSILQWFNRQPYFHPMKGCNTREAKEHFFALRATQPAMKGVILLDRNNREGEKEQAPSDGNLLVRMWKRYEIENYLVHPDAIKRFVENNSPLFTDSVLKSMRKQLPQAVLDDPLGQHDYLENTPASKSLLPEFFSGMGIGKSNYHQVAVHMNPEEIHPEVQEMLDTIAKHFGSTDSNAGSNTKRSK